MYDLRFKNPSSFIIGGASQSGKTIFTLNLIRHANELFEKPQCSQNVVYYYKQHQDSFERVKPEGIIHQWVNELPTCESVTDRTEGFKNQGSMVIIDDFAGELNADIVTMFSVLCHHLNLVLILLTQNIFSKNKVFREISLNSTYVVLFKNPRDASQINNFARQFAPGNTKYVIDAFRAATARAFSYVVFDTSQTTPDFLRMRSNVLPHEQPLTIWLPSNFSI